MGARVDIGADRTTVTGTGELHGVTVNMRDISDTMPTLAAIAPFADGPVRIEDVYEHAGEGVRPAGGVRGEPAAAGRRRGDRPRTGSRSTRAPAAGARSRLHGDHRIAMSFAVTGCGRPASPSTTRAAYKKTFPGFHEAFAELWRGTRAAG